MDLVARLCRHVFVMAAGRMLFEGTPPRRQSRDPQVIEAYLGGAAPMSEPLLAVDDLRGRLRAGAPIVRGVSLEVMAGEIVAVLGPNGAGKSTLIKAIAGLVPKFAGNVALDGKPTSRRPMPHQLCRAAASASCRRPRTSSPSCRSPTICGSPPIFLPKSERAAGSTTMYRALSRSCPAAAPRGRPPVGRAAPDARGRARADRQAAPHRCSMRLPPACRRKCWRQVFAKLAEIRRAALTILIVEQNARAALALADRAFILVEGRSAHRRNGGGHCERSPDRPALSGCRTPPEGAA